LCHRFYVLIANLFSSSCHLSSTSKLHDKRTDGQVARLYVGDRIKNYCQHKNIQISAFVCDMPTLLCVAWRSCRRCFSVSSLTTIHEEVLMRI